MFFTLRYKPQILVLLSQDLLQRFCGCIGKIDGFSIDGFLITATVALPLLNPKEIRIYPVCQILHRQVGDIHLIDQSSPLEMVSVIIAASCVDNQ